jgi:type VI secretion system protein VasI
LVFECRDGQTIARFETHCRISTSEFDDYGEVTYRVDKNSTETLRFSESDDNRSLGLWTSENSVPFLQSLKDSETLAARIKPYSDEPFVAFFDTSGFNAAVTPVANACGW